MRQALFRKGKALGAKKKKVLELIKCLIYLIVEKTRVWKIDKNRLNL